MLVLDKIGWQLPEGDEILKNITLEVPDGKMTVVTGPNGGGKTSLAKIIAGLAMPTEGRLCLDGEDITSWDMTERARHGISYAFQQPVRFKGLTVRDLLEIAAEEKLGMERICRYLGEVGLCAEEYVDRVVDASLSGGEGKRIEIATVLARKNARIRVFDEPEAGIDLWSFTNLIEVFQRLKQQKGEALLVISHQERILEIADRIVVIAGGKVRTAGVCDFFIDHKDFQGVYSAQNQIIICITPVIEVEAAQLLFIEKSSDNLFHVDAGHVVAQVNQDLCLISQLFTHQKAHPPVIDVGGVEKGLKGLIFQKKGHIGIHGAAEAV